MKDRAPSPTLFHLNLAPLPGFNWFVTFLLSFLLSVYLVISGGFIWRGDYSVHATNLLVGGLCLAGYLIWRVLIKKGRVPRLGLELVLLVALIVGLISFFTSPDPRQGLARIMLFGFYGISLYIFTDVLDSILHKPSIFHGMLLACALVILTSVAEVLFQYISWWQTVDSFKIFPPGPYRLSSILGHSNVLMPYVNLLAPLAVVAFGFARRPTGKVVYATWVLLYLVMLPFTSSRGGWLGFITWVGILLLYWAWQKGFGKVSGLLWTNRSKGFRILLIVGLLVLLSGGIVVWRYFTANASHGGSWNPLDARWSIWQPALDMIRNHPLIGIGPGRFSFEYTTVGGITPPAFWPLHAHDLFLEIGAEFGILGLAVLCALLVVGGFRVWMSFRQTPPGEGQWWSIAAIAGLCSLLVHSIVEDPTRVVPAICTALLLFALILVNSKMSLPRISHISLGVFLLPGLVLLGLEGWVSWAYRPMADGLIAAQSDDWKLAAQLISQSSERDPSFSFYQTDAGLAWARAWAVDHSPQSLQNARTYLEKSLALEPGISLMWANLSVLDWAAGDRTQAYHDIRKAIQISPMEPTYLLNLGWFEEQSGDTQLAEADYQKTLTMAPSWYKHPFFGETQLRKQALAGWKDKNVTLVTQMEAPSYSYADQANQALSDGNIKEAIRLAASSDWTSEAFVPRQITWSSIQQSLGDQKKAAAYEQGVANYSSISNLITVSFFPDAYNIWLNDRKGLLIDLVPGYLQLQPDVNQLKGLQWLVGWYINLGRCDQASQVWNAMNLYQTGGSINLASVMPPCAMK